MNLKYMKVSLFEAGVVSFVLSQFVTLENSTKFLLGSAREPSCMKTRIWPSQADRNQAHRLPQDPTALDSLQLKFLNAMKVNLGLT